LRRAAFGDCGPDTSPAQPLLYAVLLGTSAATPTLARLLRTRIPEVCVIEPDTDTAARLRDHLDRVAIAVRVVARAETGMAAGLVIALASFRLASLIGLVAGMSVGLGLGSLWLLGYPFGFMAIIGTMGLIGVAINDSIVVVSRLSQEAAIRRGDRHATVEAIIDVTRHLLATTFTTIAGFLPLILAGGGFWPPLAVAIGGGVAGATLMSVTLVPTIYHRWIAGRWDVAAAA
jgi:preprotein translocase subunit SecF